MSSDSRSDKEKAIDAMISLALKTCEVSDAEIAEFLETQGPPSVEIQKTIDAIAHNLKTDIKSGTSNTELPQVAYLRHFLEELRADANSRLVSGEKLIRLPGLDFLLSQSDLALAAAESKPILRDYIFSTEDKRAVIRFAVESDGRCLISVWDTEGEPSSILDDSIIIASSGTALARIVSANTQTNARFLEGGFTIKTSTGVLVSLKIKPE